MKPPFWVYHFPPPEIRCTCFEPGDYPCQACDEWLGVYILGSPGFYMYDSDGLVIAESRKDERKRNHT